MRAIKLVIVAVAVLSLLSACGKKTPKSTGSNPSIAGSPSTSNQPSTFDQLTPTNPNPSTPPVGGGESLLSFEFERTGHDEFFITGPIQTDNTLRVAFEVGSSLGPDVGNNTWQASELKVTIEVNNTEQTPRYSSDPNCPANGCVYGRQSDGRSNVMDFSGALNPGQQTVRIRVKNPFYDYFCVYPYFNSLFQQYPDCYKRVNNEASTTIGGKTVTAPGHKWSGRLIVETDNTVALP